MPWRDAVGIEDIFGVDPDLDVPPVVAWLTRGAPGFSEILVEALNDRGDRNVAQLTAEHDAAKLELARAADDGRRLLAAYCETRDERDAALMCVASLEARVKELESYSHGLTRMIDTIRAESPGEHPYHGPLGAPDEHGQRRAVPDPAHERFHGAIGDIIAGKILPKAREQMARELAKAPPHQETTASTPAPMPGKALGSFGDRRRIGAA